MNREPLRLVPLRDRGTGGGTDRPVAQPAPVPPASTESGTAQSAQDSTEAPPAVPGTVTPITMPERVSTAVRNLPARVREMAGELWLYPDRLIHRAWHGNAKTLAEHRAHIKNREWVPSELTGKPESFVVIAGILYHVIIARYVKAACKAVDGAADYPLAFFGLVAFVLILVLLFVL